MSESDLGLPNEREDDLKERGGKSTKSSSKVKDLSHVPCKFFKVGSCTAGPSCPFSHQANEPGQQKGVCQWYIKGSCKFGHKCALAHVLPGQPLTMDRKNKRAEQAATQGKHAPGSVPSKEKDRSDRENKRHGGAGRRDSATPKSGDVGSTVNTGTGISRSSISRPPMTIGKAPPSLSTPSTVPQLQDADFRLSDDVPRRSSTFAAAAAAGLHGTSPAGPADPPIPASALKPKMETESSDTVPVDQPLPISKTAKLGQPGRLSPIPQSRHVHRSNPSADLGFGPIGSPPRASIGTSPQPYSPSGGISLSRGLHSINGFSPSTPPSANTFEFDPATPGGFGNSAFSVPGHNPVFMPFGETGSVPARLYHGSPPPDRPSTIRGISDAWDNQASQPRRNLSGVVDDLVSAEMRNEEDLEEFLPSSLNELLTPGERSRRMSRTGGRTNTESQPRFAQSVPAASLLDNVRSLWDGSDARNSDAQTLRSPGVNDVWQRGFTGPDEPSPSLLSTSNASAAFLSGNLHRPKQMAQSLHPSSSLAAASNFDNIRSSASGYGSPSTELAFSPPRFGANHSSSHIPPHSAFLSGLQPSTRASHPIEPQYPTNSAYQALSPSARALRSHEPGQSLPQGLAAGLSRIHLIPASNPISPPPPSGGSAHDHFLSQQASWGTNTKSAQAISGSYTTTATISGIAKVGENLGAGINGLPSPSSIAIAGNSHLRRPWMAHSLSSPLSRPMATNDEDVGLFPMDEET